MTRLSVTLATVGALALAGCSDHHVAEQSVYAGNAALITAQEAAVSIAPALTPAELRTMKRLNDQAHDADKTMLLAAQNGGATGAETHAAADALAAFTSFLAAHKKGV